MGQLISAFVGNQQKKAQDQQDGAFAYIDHAIENMKQAAKQFELSCVQEIMFDKKIPISKILLSSSQVRCKVEVSVDGIANQIQQSAKKFMDGDFAKGISGILSTAVNAMVGRSSASNSYKRSYLISVGQMGSILRLDYMIHVKNATAKKIKEKVSNFVSINYIISSVKIQNLTENDLVSIVQVCYASSDHAAKQRILGRIIELIKRIKQQNALAFKQA